MSLSKTIEIDVRKDGSFDVHHGNRVADNLSYGEMLGLVTRITCVGEPVEMQWLEVPEADELENARWFLSKYTGCLRLFTGFTCLCGFELSEKRTFHSDINIKFYSDAIGATEITTEEALQRLKDADWPEGVAEARKLAGLPEETEQEEVRWYEDRFSDIRGYLGDGNVLLGTGSKEVESTDAAEHECVQDKDTKLTTEEVIAKLGDWEEGIAAAKEFAGVVVEPAEEVHWYEDERLSYLFGVLNGQSVLLDYALKEIDDDDDVEVRESDFGDDPKLTTGEVLCKLARMGWEEGWKAAREFAGLSKADAYLAGQEASGIAPGSLVRIGQVAKDGSFGWGLSWLGGMDEFVGHRVAVRGCAGICGFACEMANDFKWAHFPFFVLSKVEQEAEAADPATGDKTNWREGILKAVEPVADWFCLGEEENTDSQLIGVVGEIAGMLNEDRQELLKLRKLARSVLDWSDSRVGSVDCLDELGRYFSTEGKASPPEPGNEHSHLIGVGEWVEKDGKFHCVRAISKGSSFILVSEDGEESVAGDPELNKLPKVGEWQKPPIATDGYRLPVGTKIKVESGSCVGNPVATVVNGHGGFGETNAAWVDCKEDGYRLSLSESRRRFMVVEYPPCPEVKGIRTGEWEQDSKSKWVRKETGSQGKEQKPSEVDPGEGYFIVDKEKDGPVRKGDQFFCDGKWFNTTHHHSGQSFADSLTYRRKLPAKAKVGDFVREKGATKEGAKFKVTRVDKTFVYGGEKWLNAHSEVDIVDPPQAKVGDWVQSVADDCHEDWKDRPLEVCRVSKGCVYCKVSDHKELAIKQGNYEIVNEPLKVKVGDWVRFKDLNPPEPFPVNYVNEAGVIGGNRETGSNHALHGDYEIVAPPKPRREPEVGEYIRCVWPHNEQCDFPIKVTGRSDRGKMTVAYPSNPERELLSRDSYEIVRKVVKPWTFGEACKAFAKHGMTFQTSHSVHEVVEIRGDGVQTNRGYFITFECLSDSHPCPVNQFAWNFPDGTPCGTVDWEVVE